jgi:hypothetical protein
MENGSRCTVHKNELMYRFLCASLPFHCANRKKWGAHVLVFRETCVFSQGKSFALPQGLLH